MLVSLYMIAYNEEKCLDEILGDILAQSYPHADTEIVVTDNGSTDRTYEILCGFKEKYINEYRDIKILKNDCNTIPVGLNVCIKNTTGDVVVRVDAHASIAPDFIEESVACLEGTHTGIREYACGGMRPTYTVENDGMSAMLLSVEESRFGASAANYRGSLSRTYVDTVFHAAYRREVIEKVGLYDERLLRTEDNNYNWRIRQAGYKICFEPRIKSKQQIRSSLPKMLKQKNGNGYWIGYTLGITPECISLFQLIPMLFVLGSVICAVLAAFGLSIFGALMWGAYTLCSLVFSIKAIIDAPRVYIHHLLMPLVFLLMHFSYGIGTIKGIAVMLGEKITKKGESKK